jgi:hypothetical protein
MDDDEPSEELVNEVETILMIKMRQFAARTRDPAHPYHNKVEFNERGWPILPKGDRSSMEKALVNFIRAALAEPEVS